MSAVGSIGKRDGIALFVNYIQFQLCVGIDDQRKEKGENE